MRELPYGRQDITDADIEAVTEALRSPFITQGPSVSAFEEKLAAAVGARFAVVVNSGTAALHAAYFAAGVGPGRDVLTSAMTFAATANAALYLGGGVRFGDIDGDTGQLDPAGLDAAASPATHVVTPVHYSGHVADVENIAAIAKRHGWLVVEDACHALGASYADRAGQTHRVGACAHSAMCCFSFHPVKHITTGEGGAVTTNDESLYRKLKRFRTHGITRDPSELQANEGAWYYEQQDLGFNYRITDFQCALGASQLARLGEFVEARRRIAALYDEAFAGSPLARPLAAPAPSRGSYHLYVVRVPASERRRVFDELRTSGIGVNVHYVPVYKHPYYRTHGFSGFALANTEALYAGAMSIPMFPGLSGDDVNRVVDTLLRSVAAGPAPATAAPHARTARAAR